MTIEKGFNENWEPIGVVEFVERRKPFHDHGPVNGVLMFDDASNSSQHSPIIGNGAVSLSKGATKKY
jgi:hypothetical protein